MIEAAAIICGYLIGSIPFGYLIGKMVSGKDVREGGSGATGATNVTRQLGIKWGIPVAVLDISKGAVPVILTQKIAPAPEWLFAAVALATIIGHIYPVWLHFRGGKGISTALGAAIVIAPWGSVIAVVAFIAAFAIGRLVSVGSLAAVVVYAVSVLAFGSKIGALSLGAKIFAVALPIIVIWTHRKNIGRIIKGEELSPIKGQKEIR